MHDTPHQPIALPARILGTATLERQELLARVDVVVGYTCARHRLALAGWEVSAALVEARAGFRGGETVAVRARPAAGRSVHDVAPFPARVLHELALRLMPMEGLAQVVPDIAAPAPDVEGRLTATLPIDVLGTGIGMDDDVGGGAQIA